jgi:Type III restriction enzyme, res subunit
LINFYNQLALTYTDLHPRISFNLATARLPTPIGTGRVKASLAEEIGLLLKDWPEAVGENINDLNSKIIKHLIDLNIEPRSYLRDTLSNLKDWLERSAKNENRVNIVWDTSLGKGNLITILSSLLGRNKVLVVTNYANLSENLYKSKHISSKKLSHTTYLGLPDEDLKRVTFCVNRRVSKDEHNNEISGEILELLKDFTPQVVLVDEANNLQRDNFKKAIDIYSRLGCLIIAMTATPYKDATSIINSNECYYSSPVVYNLRCQFSNDHLNGNLADQVFRKVCYKFWDIINTSQLKNIYFDSENNLKPLIIKLADKTCSETMIDCLRNLSIHSAEIIDH